VNGARTSDRLVKLFGGGRAWVRQMPTMEIQLLGEIRLRRGDAGEQAVAGAAGGWLERRGIAKTVIDEAGGRDLRRGKYRGAAA